MEILILVLLYYLSQNPNFAESVKPLMGQIKDSEQMLNFLNDLSKFSGAFGSFAGNSNPKNESHQETSNGNKQEQHNPDKDTAQASAEQEDKKSPQSPTKGIADEFIQNILDNYLKKHWRITRWKNRR